MNQKWPYSKSKPCTGSDSDNASDYLVAPEVCVEGITVALVDKGQASKYLGNSKELVTRLLWHARHSTDPWIKIAANAKGIPKAKTLISAESLRSAATRILNGEYPPPAPRRPRKIYPTR